MIPIDPWAYNLARDVAAETGWRASDVYDLAVRLSGDRYAHESIEAALVIIKDLRLNGESFEDTLARLDRIMEGREEEQ